MEQAEIQVILDHYGLGHVLHVTEHDGQTTAATEHGKYVVVAGGTDLSAARNLQTSLLEQWGSGAKLHLLPNFQGEPTPESSFVHHDGQYYCVIELGGN